MAEEIKKPNTQAESQVIDPQIAAAEAVEQQIEKIDEGTQPEAGIIDEIAKTDGQGIKAEPAAEAASIEIHEDVKAVGVKGNHEGKHANDVVSENQGNVHATGENHPADAVDGSNIQLPEETFNTPDAKALQKDPSNATAAHNLVEERKSLLAKAREFFASRFIAGSKIPESPSVSSVENIAQFPTSSSNPVPAQEKKQAA